jgi:hypothetical protein
MIVDGPAPGDLGWVRLKIDGQLSPPEQKRLLRWFYKNKPNLWREVNGN